MNPAITLAVLLAVAIGFAGAYWNARITGKIWLEAKAVGGWVRLLAWCGAAQSVVGFSINYSLLVGIPAALYLDIKLQFTEYEPFWLFLLLEPVLVTGAFIFTLESWRRGYRDKSLLILGFAAWNISSAASSLYQKAGPVGKAVAGMKQGLKRKKAPPVTGTIRTFNSYVSGGSGGSGGSSDNVAVVGAVAVDSFGGGDTGGVADSAPSGSIVGGGSGDGKDSWKLYLIMVIVLLSVCGGYWTTRSIMRTYIGTDPLPFDEARLVT